MVKPFMLNIPADVWELIEKATVDQPTKTKWIISTLREAALARLPPELKPGPSEPYYPPAPPYGSTKRKPWLHLGPYTEPEEIVKHYSRSTLLEWADKHRQTWYESNDALMMVKVRYALDGQPYVRPAMVLDGGAWRIATPAEIEAMTDEQRAAEEAKGCVLPPRKGAAVVSDDWA